MAAKLSVQIALEGAKEIERQLEGIGEAGQKAFADISKEANNIGSFKELDPTFVSQKFQDLGVKAPEALAKVQQAVQEASRLEGLVSGLSLVETALAKAGIAGKALLLTFGPLGAAATVLAGIVGGMLVRALIKSAEAIQDIDAQAIKLGLTIEQFDRMRITFEKAGVSSKAITEGIAAFAGEIDKLNVAKVEAAAKAVQELGFGPALTNAWRTLREQAEGTGKAAELAQQKIAELSGTEASTALGKIAEQVERTGRAFTTADQALRPVLESLLKMEDTVKRDALTLQIFKGQLGVELVQSMRNSGVSVDELAEKVDTMTQRTVNRANATVEALNRLKAAFSRLNLDIQPAPIGIDFGALIKGFDQLVTMIQGFSWSSFVSAGQAALNTTLQELIAIGSAIQSVIDLVGGAFTSAWSSVGGAASSAMQMVSDAVQTAIGWIEKAIQTLASFLGMGGGGAGAAPAGMAGGGMIGGRGTGTSDSNLAWVSRGEHIMPARAVGQPGVLAFLEALRRSGGNLRHVLDRMGHFALGGLVQAPAFASGGMAGMSHVTIQFPGLPAIGGLRASSAVVDELRKAAVMAQVRSGGRKPSRYS